MKTIIIDAGLVMQAANPIQYVGSLFGVEAENPEQLRLKLAANQENVIVEVVNWPPDEQGWEPIADLLEGVQQHSSYFYLIWGTAKDYVDTKAKPGEPVLINPPLDDVPAPLKA